MTHNRTRSSFIAHGSHHDACPGSRRRVDTESWIQSFLDPKLDAILGTVSSEDTVVVIGSGPAGAAATLMLTSAGAKVTLLEAGLARTERGLTARVGGLTIARIHRTLEPRSDGIRVTGDPSTQLYE